MHVGSDGEPGAWVCDAEVSAKHLVNAGMSMASETMGQGLAAVYGRAHDSVTGLYAIMRGGERVDWPVHHDPRNAERYFAVIADCQELTDIIAVAGRRRASLKGNFGIWFCAAPLRQARCSHNWAAEAYRRGDRDRAHNSRRPLDPANR